LIQASCVYIHHVQANSAAQEHLNDWWFIKHIFTTIITFSFKYPFVTCALSIILLLQFLVACTAKLDLTSHARILYDWEGNEITSLANGKYYQLNLLFFSN